MRCKEIEILLLGYHENSLNPAERERVEQHLAGCESCRLKLKEIGHTYLLLAKESVPSPQESFWINFLPEVRSRIERERKPKWVLIPKTRLAFGLLSLLAVAIISLFIFDLGEKNLVERESEQMAESILSPTDLSSSVEQLTDLLSTEEGISINEFLSNGEGQELELTEEILEEDYLSQRSLNSILNELDVEELKQLEESMKTLQIGDIL